MADDAATLLTIIELQGVNDAIAQLIKLGEAGQTAFQQIGTAVDEINNKLQPVGVHIQQAGEHAEKGGEALRELGAKGREAFEGIAVSSEKAVSAVDRISFEAAIGAAETFNKTLSDTLSILPYVGRAAAGLVEGFTLAAGATAALTIGLFELSKSAAETVREINNLATQSGTTVNGIVNLKSAFSDAGVGAQQFGVAMRFLAIRISNDLPEIRKSVRDTADILTADQIKIQETASALAGAGDQTKKTFIAAREAVLNFGAAEQKVAEASIQLKEADIARESAHSRVISSRLAVTQAEQSVAHAEYELARANGAARDKDYEQYLRIKDAEIALESAKQREVEARRQARQATLEEEKAQLSYNTALQEQERVQLALEKAALERNETQRQVELARGKETQAAIDAANARKKLEDDLAKSTPRIADTLENRASRKAAGLPDTEAIDEVNLKLATTRDIFDAIILTAERDQEHGGASPANVISHMAAAFQALGDGAEASSKKLALVRQIGVRQLGEEFVKALEELGPQGVNKALDPENVNPQAVRFRELKKQADEYLKGISAFEEELENVKVNIGAAFFKEFNAGIREVGEYIKENQTAITDWAKSFGRIKDIISDVFKVLSGHGDEVETGFVKALLGGFKAIESVIGIATTALTKFNDVLTVIGNSPALNLLAPGLKEAVNKKPEGEARQPEPNEPPKPEDPFAKSPTLYDRLFKKPPPERDDDTPKPSLPAREEGQVTPEPAKPKKKEPEHHAAADEADIGRGETVSGAAPPELRAAFDASVAQDRVGTPEAGAAGIAALIVSAIRTALSTTTGGVSPAYTGVNPASGAPSFHSPLTGRFISAADATAFGEAWGAGPGTAMGFNPAGPITIAGLLAGVAGQGLIAKGKDPYVAASPFETGPEQKLGTSLDKLTDAVDRNTAKREEKLPIEPAAFEPPAAQPEPPGGASLEAAISRQTAEPNVELHTHVDQAGNVTTATPTPKVGPVQLALEQQRAVTEKARQEREAAAAAPPAEPLPALTLPTPGATRRADEMGAIPYERPAAPPPPPETPPETAPPAQSGFGFFVASPVERFRERQRKATELSREAAAQSTSEEPPALVLPTPGATRKADEMGYAPPAPAEPPAEPKYTMPPGRFGVDPLAKPLAELTEAAKLFAGAVDKDRASKETDQAKTEAARTADAYVKAAEKAESKKKPEPTETERKPRKGEDDTTVHRADEEPKVTRTTSTTGREPVPGSYAAEQADYIKKQIAEGALPKDYMERRKAGETPGTGPKIAYVPGQEPSDAEVPTYTQKRPGAPKITYPPGEAPAPVGESPKAFQLPDGTIVKPKPGEAPPAGAKPINLGPGVEAGKPVYEPVSAKTGSPAADYVEPSKPVLKSKDPADLYNVVEGRKQSDIDLDKMTPKERANRGYTDVSVSGPRYLRDLLPGDSERLGRPYIDPDYAAEQTAKRTGDMTEIGQRIKDAPTGRMAIVPTPPSRPEGLGVNEPDKPVPVTIDKPIEVKQDEHAPAADATKPGTPVETKVEQATIDSSGALTVNGEPVINATGAINIANATVTGQGASQAAASAPSGGGSGAASEADSGHAGGGLIRFVDGGVIFAGGGHVQGPGGPKTDSIIARVSNGEYVVNADAVKHYGVSFMDHVNQKRFADGGPVASAVNIAETASPGIYDPERKKHARGPLTFAIGGLVDDRDRKHPPLNLPMLHDQHFSKGFIEKVSHVTTSFAEGGYVGRMEPMRYAEGGPLSGGNVGREPMHTIDLRTNTGNYTAKASEGTVAAMKRASVTARLKATGTKPSWYQES